MNEIFGVCYRQIPYQVLDGILDFYGYTIIDHDIIYSVLAEYVDNDIYKVIVWSAYDYPEYNKYKTLRSDGKFKYDLPIIIILRLADPDMVREAFDHKREKINELERELFGNAVNVKSAKY